MRALIAADFQAAFGNDAAEVDAKNPQKNARVLIATYQTLDQDQGGVGAMFFLEHYPPGYFDVIVVDECHRSAWGDWFVILEKNQRAIQIGLTATPRQIRLPEARDEDTRRQIEEDRRLLADNLRYFGEPACEYTYQQGVADGYLAPAEIETYDLFHDLKDEAERLSRVERKDLAGKTLTNALTGAAVPIHDVPEQTLPGSLELRLIMPDRVKGVGRGTRLHEETGKLMFRIFDYTGATALFGAEFISPPPPPPPDGPKPPPPSPPPPIKVKGVQVEVVNTRRFNLMSKDGRLTRVTPQEYQHRLIEELTATVPTLAEFRARWLDPEAHREMMNELAAQNLIPGLLQEASHMEAYDEFDVLAALAYGVPPLTRAQRAARFGDTGPDWLIRLPQPTAKVIRKIVRQFEKAGTGALESGQLWNTIGEPNALDSLRQGGQPAELLRRTKETLFAA